MPAHGGTHGPHNLDRCDKPLPDLPAESEKQEAPDIEWIDELPAEVPIEQMSTEEIESGLLQGGYKTQNSRPNVPSCARGSSKSNKHRPRPNIPQRMSSIRPRLRSTRWEDRNGRILDRDVLRGLHIAASAACNESVDAFIRNQTGLHLRWLLANLIPLETLEDQSLNSARVQRDKRRAAINGANKRTRGTKQKKKPARRSP